LQNISGNHAATWWQKLAAEIGSRNWQQKLAAETGSRNWQQKLAAETGSRNWQLISPHLPLFLFIFR
jgi:hypothetical protein